MTTKAKEQLTEAMDLKEEILSKYETYVTMRQPHNTTPIFLKENVMEAMEIYADALIKAHLECLAK